MSKPQAGHVPQQLTEAKGSKNCDLLGQDHLTQLPRAGEEEAQKLELEICSHAQREAVALDRELFCSYQEENKALNSFLESI